jgi:phosphocarrier protein FPr/phosphocarrier protein
MIRVGLGAPVAGWLTSVRDVPDPVFSEEMLGVGIAIDPTDGTIVAPCAGEVVVVAPSAHSVTLRADDGAEILIHVGLETVALDGRGFEAHVAAGAKVAAGDRLISFDLDLVALEAKSLVTPIILTNPDMFELALDPLGRLVESGEAIGSIIGKAGISEAGVTTGNRREVECTVGFAHGLHARPAARIADCAKSFSSEVAIAAGSKQASARSPVALMALNVAGGDRVTVAATGEDSEAAAATVAELIEQGEDEQRAVAAPVPVAELAPNELAGICALPGTALGIAFRWLRNAVQSPEEGQGVEHETAALAEARDAISARLRSLGAGTTGPGGDIADAHLGIIDDEELNAAAAAAIAEGKSAGRAWTLATERAAAALEATGNAILRERVSDLRDVCVQLVAVLHGTQPMPAPDLPQGAILVADDLMPSELLSLDRARLAGIAIGGGGPTSHVAIIAASFGVPTLVAIGPELSRVEDGASVLLDASAGKLVIDPDERARSRVASAAIDAADTGGECRTRDGERVRLLANLGGLGDVEPALAAGAEGCGLLRTEFLFLDRERAPGEKEQREAYQAIADALGGRPLTIRTLDIGGDKPVGYIAFPPEQNPALGLRGIRTGMIAPDLLDAQLRAIARVSGDAVKVMIPMVSSVEELRSVRDRLGPHKVGIMVETPAAALTAQVLAREADFLSIGSNDLAQYALAMDRTNPLLAGAIDALHPAVLRLIAMTAEAGRAAGKPVSLCGGLASDPLGALVLLGLGLRELSAVPAAIAAVRQAIAGVSIEECKLLATRALELESAAQVRALAAEHLNAPTQGGQA